MAAAGLPPPGGLVIVRHGATEWSENGRHTSRTDLPLLESGRSQAVELGERLDPGAFDLVLCSPLRRARETCSLAGFGGDVEIVEDLREWDYGDYEGITTAEIHAERPDWWLWRDGCPDGESPEEVAARADRVLERVLVAGSGGERTAIAFAHGHILRVLAARWIELGVEGGSRLVLGAGRLGVLGHEHEQRAIRGWNVTQL